LHFVSEYFTLQSVGMTVFDLIFMVLFLTSCVTLMTAAVTFLWGNRPRAVRILKTFGICFVIYMAIVAVVALAAPQRVVQLGEDHCSDDWCIAVERADHQPTKSGVTYTLTIQLSSRARRVTQREKGVRIYLTAAGRQRFDPAPDPTAIPLDVLLHPGEAVETTRVFTLPNDARDVGAVIAHQQSFCFPGCFIIGDGSLLHKYSTVPLR
jgi:hypothetical protein